MSNTFIDSIPSIHIKAKSIETEDCPRKHSKFIKSDAFYITMAPLMLSKYLESKIHSFIFHSGANKNLSRHLWWMLAKYSCSRLIFLIVEKSVKLWLITKSLIIHYHQFNSKSFFFSQKILRSPMNFPETFFSFSFALLLCQ